MGIKARDTECRDLVRDQKVSHQVVVDRQTGKAGHMAEEVERSI